MSESLGYVVCTYNQASHLPGLPMAADLHSELEDAVNARDWERAETAKAGRRERHVIAEVFEFDEDEIPGRMAEERSRWTALAAKERAQ